MASRGHMPELMQRAGIELLKPAAAAPYVFRELAFASAGEAVIAGSLGQMEAELSPGNALNAEKANATLQRKQPGLAMLHRVVQFTPEEGFVFESELDPAQEPFLRDHAREGIPLLPGVMGVEAFVEAAQVLADAFTGKANGLALDYLDGIQFWRPQVLPRSTAALHPQGARSPEGDGLCIRVRLESLLERFGRRRNRCCTLAGRYTCSQRQKARTQNWLPRNGKRMEPSLLKRFTSSTSMGQLSRY